MESGELSQKILIIEDDPDIADLMRIHLQDLGFSIDIAINGITGLEKSLSKEYALIILDLMLPELGGMEVCRRIRDKNKYTPILMVTSKSEEMDKVLGLELGADDYITKPFSIREFIARVKAIVRRLAADKERAASSADDGNTELRYGALCIYPERRKVLLNEKHIDLTAKEFDLLTLFASHPGRAYSRQELLNQVWGYQFEGYDHTVNSHINRLRGKIEANPSEPIYIKTVWGVGYRFTELEEIPV